MHICHDKYTVRQYVAHKGYEDILIPLYQVVEKSDELGFDSLPERFVLKTTNSGDTNIFCHDKKTFNWDEACKRLDGWAQEDVVGTTLQKSLNSKARIIVEEMLGRDENNDLIDYRMFCFNGKLFATCVTTDYVDDHKQGRMGFVDREWNLMSYTRLEYRPFSKEPQKPYNYNRMVEIAETLSDEFPHCRVDLYSLGEKIFFGEMTFITMGGYCRFIPDEFDFILGEQFTYY